MSDRVLNGFRIQIDILTLLHVKANQAYVYVSNQKEDGYRHNFTEN